MLDYELRKKGEPHNCLDDACAAMKLVLAKLEGKTGDVIAEEVLLNSFIHFTLYYSVLLYPFMHYYNS